MTTTVKRGAGRPAASARSAKHAQRNVQTGPNPTVGVIAAVAGEEAGQERADSYGRMTVPELRARYAELTGKPAPTRKTKGELMNAILGAERKQDRAAEYAAANAEQDLLPQDADSPGGEYIPDPQPATSNAPETEAEPKGSAKALKLHTALAQHGWIYDRLVGGPDGRVTAILTRRQETLTVTWDSGVFNYEETSHAVGDRVTKVRNVSAAIAMGSRPAEAAEKDLERVVRNRTFNKAKVAAEGAPARRKLPFDPETVTEAELAALLAGKTLEWTNRITRGTETARVTDRSSKFFKLTDGPAGRTLQFTSAEGFRACRLADIIRVGGSLRKSAQNRDAEPVAA